MRRDKHEIRQFNSRVSRLMGTERTLREAYEVTERYYKRQTGKRFYKNYGSFRKSRSYHIKKDNLRENKRRFNSLFERRYE